MSVVYTEPGPTPAPPASAGSRLVNFAQEHIVLAGVMLLALALAIGFLVNKIRGGSSSSTQQPQTLYVPTQNTFENVYTSGSSSDGTSGGSPIPPPNFLGPPQGNPDKGFIQHWMVRSATTSGPAASWDASQHGVPIRDTPDVNGSILGLVPFGSALQPNGPGVSGSNNFGGSTQGGSSQWFPVTFNGQTGYISAFDLIPQSGFLAPGPGGVNTGSGADPFHDGHPVSLRTIFSMNHGVAHHVNNVIGA